MSIRWALLLFLAALAVRLIYQVALSGSRGTNMDVDSFPYFGLAEKILAGGHITAAGVLSAAAIRVSNDCLIR